MPKNWDANKEKVFYTRVVYNSKFKSVSKNEANKNIRKNVQHIGKNHGVNSDALGKVAKVQEAPIQKCNIVQGVYYNVPVINRFDSLDIEDSLSVNTCDNVLDNVRINVPKQAQKYIVMIQMVSGIDETVKNNYKPKIKVSLASILILLIILTFETSWL